MAEANAELLEGIHTDLDHPKAATHAAKLNLEGAGDGAYDLSIDISAHAESPPHHTSWIKVFVNDTPAGYIQPEPPYYTGEFNVRLTEITGSDTIRVQCKCNLHGVWESSVSV